MSDSPWKDGRKFTVVKVVVDVDSGRSYHPGTVYEVGKFGMIRFARNDLALQPESRYWQSTEVERYMLLQHITWDDCKPSKISNGLRRFIEQSPTSKFVRGFLRQEIGIVPAKKDTPTTADGWFEFIDQAEVVPPPASKQSLVARLAAAGGGATGMVGAAAVPEPTVVIEVSGREHVYGRAEFDRVDHFSGTMEVPVSIMEQGFDRIEAYIRDNLEDWIDRDEGECNWSDESVNDSEGFIIEESTISEVLDAFQHGNALITAPRNGQGEEQPVF